MKKYLVVLTIMLMGVLSLKAQVYMSGDVYWGAFDVQTGQKAQVFEKIGQVQLVEKRSDECIVHYSDIKDGLRKTFKYKKVKDYVYADDLGNQVIIQKPNYSSLYILHTERLPVSGRNLILMVEILNLR